MKSPSNNSLNNEGIYYPTRILNVGRFQGCFSDVTNNPVFPAFCSGILNELVAASLTITRCLQQLQVSCLQWTLSYGRKRGVSSHISYYQGEKPFLKASLQTSPFSSLAPFLNRSPEGGTRITMNGLNCSLLTPRSGEKPSSLSKWKGSN